MAILDAAVATANRIPGVDAVLLGGDWIHDPDHPDAVALYGEIRACFDRLTHPWLVISGNHDQVPEDFYSFFPRPGPIEEFGDVRVLAFLDADAPGWCAHRSIEDIARFQSARADWHGSIVSFQHMSFHPPGVVACRFNLTNADDVIREMREHKVTLSLGGHHHDGFHCREQGIDFVCGRALCESRSIAVIEDGADGMNVSYEEIG